MTERPRRDWRDAVFSRREGISTVLMGIAAVMTTWCAFQSTLWSGRQSIQFAEASAARVESTRNEIIDLQEVQVDIVTFLAWVEALRSELGAQGMKASGPYVPDPTTLSGFLFERFRPDFRPVVHAWVALRPLQSPDAPRTPFLMKEYRRARAEAAARRLREAEAKAKAGGEANQISDKYMLTTVITAFVVFFAGMSAKLTLRNNGVVLITLAVVALLACAFLLTRLPVALS